MQAIHGAVLRSGKVILAGLMDDVGDCVPDVVILDPLTEVCKNVGWPFPNTLDDHVLFCGAQSAMTDGRILWVGGGARAVVSSGRDCPGTDQTTIYDPANTFTDGQGNWGTGQWIVGPPEIWPMDPNNPLGSLRQTRRWYPTMTMLGDGRFLILDGACECVGCGDQNPINCNPEDDGYPFCNGNPRIPVILDTSAGSVSQWAFTPLYDAHYCYPHAGLPCPVGPTAPPASPNPPCPTGGVPASPFDLAYYPFVFTLSDAKIYVPSSPYGTIAGNVGRKLHDKSGTWITQNVPTPPIIGGAAVLFGRDRIMLAGGPTQNCAENCGVHGPDTSLPDNRVYVLENAATATSWTQKAAMNHRRWHFYLTAMPDGTVLACGGTSAEQLPPDYPPTTTQPAEYQFPDCYRPSAVLEAESFNPATNEWCRMASMAVPRQYHSAVLLLQDGSVLAAGGQVADANDPIWRINNQWTYQIYKPPYFFQGARPLIQSAPEQVVYGDSFIVVPDASVESITRVRLIRLGSVTHSINFDQRMLELDFAPRPNGLQVIAPSSGNEAPPGYYMLFICTGPNGSIPSVAKFIQLIPAT